MRELTKFKLVIFLALLLTVISCSGMQSQKSSTETITEVVAETALVETITETSQDAVQASGANVRGDVDRVSTINYAGIDLWTLLSIFAAFAGFGVLMGILIPRPKIIRWLF